MKIIIVGGSGTIGKAIVEELKPRHEIVIVTPESTPSVDMTSPSSIEQMYQAIGKFDALIIAAGKVHFDDLSKMDMEKYQIGINDKLMGQVQLVMLGLNHIADGGSFTLTSGILSDEPIKAGTSASMVNGAINSFVKAAAIEMPRNIRINAVSPTVIKEAYAQYESFFRGFKPVPAAEAALAFSKSVEGLQTGQIYAVGW